MAGSGTRGRDDYYSEEEEPSEVEVVTKEKCK